MVADSAADSLAEPQAELEPPRRTAWSEALEALLVAVLFATFARGFVVQAFKIPSGSMEQNLLVGDHILVNKFIFGPSSALERWFLPARPVRRGDVVVFKFPEDPGRDFVKRCVGLPGDRVELVNKKLSVNGTPIDESAYVYLSDPLTFPAGFASGPQGLRDNYPPFEVPADHYFCLGDNRDNSNDSRAWGPVPRGYLKGRAVMVYWSVTPAPEGEGSIPPASSLGKLGRFFSSWSRLVGGTRWQRCFKVVR